VLEVWLKWQSTCLASAKMQNSRPSTANLSPSQKTKSYCTNTHRVITVSNMLYKQFIKRVNSTECLLPEKVKGFKGFRGIKCSLNSWEMWSLCSASSILALCNLQWCFFPFFSQRYFIIYWKFLHVWVLCYAGNINSSLFCH
jgi:hypothetical protein